jgi:hypothetical protein
MINDFSYALNSLHKNINLAWQNDYIVKTSAVPNQYNLHYKLLITIIKIACREIKCYASIIVL